MNPQRLGEKGSYSNITRLSFWPRFWVRNRLGASGTDEVRKRGQGSVGEMGRNPVPLGDNYSKIGERGWHWEKITRRKVEPTLTNGGEAFPPQRRSGLAREPGRTLQGGNLPKLERPRHHQASLHHEKKNTFRIFVSVRLDEFGPGKLREKERERGAKGVRVPAGRTDALLAPAAQPAVAATLCACLFLLLLKPAPTS